MLKIVATFVLLVVIARLLSCSRTLGCRRPRRNQARQTSAPATKPIRSDHLTRHQYTLIPKRATSSHLWERPMKGQRDGRALAQ